MNATLLGCKTACDDAPGCTSFFYDPGQQQCFIKSGECPYNDICTVRGLGGWYGRRGALRLLEVALQSTQRPKWPFPTCSSRQPSALARTIPAHHPQAPQVPAAGSHYTGCFSLRQQSVPLSPPSPHPSVPIKQPSSTSAAKPLRTIRRAHLCPSQAIAKHSLVSTRAFGGGRAG